MLENKKNKNLGQLRLSVNRLMNNRILALYNNSHARLAQAGLGGKKKNDHTQPVLARI